MPFDPAIPGDRAPNSSAQMRAQLNSLKALIDAVLASAVVDEVTTLPPGSPATVTVSLVDAVLHLSFGIPQGSNGSDGPPGPQGGPGEVTNATLADAVSSTARNPTGLTPMTTPFADPASEELRGNFNALLGALLRLPT